MSKLIPLLLRCVVFFQAKDAQCLLPGLMNICTGPVLSDLFPELREVIVIITLPALCSVCRSAFFCKSLINLKAIHQGTYCVSGTLLNSGDEANTVAIVNSKIWVLLSYKIPT